MGTSDEAPVESTLGLGDPRRELSGELISERDMVASALFGKPIPSVRIAKYRVVRRLGEGAMGVVYEGRDEDLERTVALKVIQADALLAGDAEARFRREAKALARLSHPNVVTIHEIGEHADQIFIAMELVVGRTLRSWLSERPTPRWQDCLQVFLAAGRGLGAAHDAGLVHRDFKPANCMVGDDGRVRVLDFGLARGTAVVDTTTSAHDTPSSAPLDSALTATGALVGTPAYMAPEQLRGSSVDAASDQFAFCVALYEGLVGVRPFSGSSAYALYEDVRRGSPRPPESARTNVPAGLMQIVLRGVAYEPDARWPDMHALLEALAAFPVRRRRLRLAAIGGLAATIAGTGLVFAAQPEPCAVEASMEVPGWAPEERAVVRSAVLSDGERARPAWETFDRAAERWAETWLEMRLEGCLDARVRGRTTEGGYARQASCLDQRARRFSVYADELASKEAAWLSVDRFAAALPSLDECRNPTRLLSIDPPSPAVADAVGEVRDTLDRAFALHVAGPVAEAQAQGDAAWARARELDSPQLRAEVNQFRARFRDGVSVEQPETMLLEAFGDAEKARDDHLAARVAIQLIGLTAEAGHGRAARDWEVVAAAKLGRIGDAPEVVAQLELASAKFALRRADHVAALEHIDRSLVGFEQTRGSESPMYVAALQDRALALELGNDSNAAAEAHATAVEANRATFGEHPATAYALFNRGNFWFERGENEHARRDHAAALAMLRGVDGQERLTARVMMALAWVDSMTGQTLDAGTLEAAVRPLEGLPATDPSRIEAAQWRAAMLLRLDEPRAALDLYDGLVRTYQRLDPPPRVELALARSNAAECELKLGRFEAARTRCIRALDELEEALPEGDPRLAYVLYGLGESTLRLGNAVDARPHLERASKLLETGWGDVLQAARVHWSLAQALAEAPADSSRARASAETARAHFTTLGAEGASEVAAITQWLGELDEPRKSSPAP